MINRTYYGYVLANFVDSSGGRPLCLLMQRRDDTVSMRLSSSKEDCYEHVLDFFQSVALDFSVRHEFTGRQISLLLYFDIRSPNQREGLKHVNSALTLMFQRSPDIDRLNNDINEIIETYDDW